MGRDVTDTAHVRKDLSWPIQAELNQPTTVDPAPSGLKHADYVSRQLGRFTRTMNAVGDNVLLPCFRVVKSGVVAMLSGYTTRTHFSQSRRRLHCRSDNGRHHHSDNGRLG